MRKMVWLAVVVACLGTAWLWFGPTGGDETHAHPAASADVVAQLQLRVQQEPENLEAVRELDHAFATRGEFDRSVALWDAFLRRRPNHARAYFERGGAYHHMGKTDQALADAKRACDLGLAEACQRAGKVR